MGNFMGAEDQADGIEKDSLGANYHGLRRNSSKVKVDATCLVKLFERLESTATGENKSDDPTHLSKATFENAFEGELRMFGQLLFLQMVHGHTEKGRISQHHFVKSGKEILRLTEETLRRYYFTLFASSKDHLTKSDAHVMVRSCYTLTLMASKIQPPKLVEDKVFDSLVNSMFGTHDSLTLEALCTWMSWNSSHLFTGTHTWLVSVLQGARMPSEQDIAEVPHLDSIQGGGQLISMPVLWALSTTLHRCYLHQGEQTPSPTSSHHLLNTYLLVTHQAHLSRFQSWSILYNSGEHGLSANRFSHHVTSYHGPSVMLVAFEGHNIYCVASDTEWREGSSSFGGSDCQLIQVSPVYRVIQVGSGLLQWNERSRDRPRGIQIGKDSKTPPLFIPRDFDSVRHYGVDCRLHSVEVWSVGSQASKLAQAKQKKWETKEVEKSRQQKLRLDPNWEENPDKAILEWGGIRTSHAEK